MGFQKKLGVFKKKSWGVNSTYPPKMADQLNALVAGYPDAVVHGGFVCYLSLEAYNEHRDPGEEVTLKANEARISAPEATILREMRKVPFFQMDKEDKQAFRRMFPHFVPDQITFQDKARLVYLASQYPDPAEKNALYDAFKRHWLEGKARSVAGVRVNFEKDGAVDMVMKF